VCFYYHDVVPGDVVPGDVVGEGVNVVDHGVVHPGDVVRGTLSGLHCPRFTLSPPKSDPTQSKKDWKYCKIQNAQYSSRRHSFVSIPLHASQ